MNQITVGIEGISKEDFERIVIIGKILIQEKF